MLEKQRLTYLEAMGIDSYMPSVQLPGAMPSCLLDDALLQSPTAFSTNDILEPLASPPLVVEPESNSIESQENLQRENSPSQSLSALLDSNTNNAASLVDSQESIEKITHSIDVETNTKAGHSLPVSVTDTTTNNPSPIRFTLTVWRVDDLLIVDSRQPGAALPTDRLLQNILRSIGYSVAQLPASELLRWPLFTSPAFASQCANQDAQEARAMVQAYISAQCQKVPTRAVLALGEAATCFALTPQSEQANEQFFADCQGKNVSSSHWQAQTLVAPSLIDMLQEPIKKRITWQVLQTLFSQS